MAKNYYGISDTGRVRDNNEDTFIAEKVLSNRYILACVIDGVGGYEGGEVASRIARETILGKFSTTPPDVIESMKEALILVNENIQSEKKLNSNHSQMACVLTMALVDLSSNKFFYAHVGDTRLYLLRDSSLVKITKDHSFVGFLEDSGRLTEAQAMSHPKRNEINKALGFDAQVGLQADYIETGESPFLPGDTILLCSDGLTDMANNTEITAVLTAGKSLVEKGNELVEIANNKGGKDNITVALVQHDVPRTEQVAIQPAALKKNEDREVEFLQDLSADGSPIDKLPAQTSGNKKIITILFVVCGALLVALLWSLFREPAKKIVMVQPERELEKTTPAKERSQQEQKLFDRLNALQLDTLQLDDTTFQQSIIIAHTISIRQDTIFINGNGRTFIADSLFAGPAISLSPNSKQVVLDSITFQNFDVAVLTFNQALHLRNVQFKNCKTAVQTQAVFNDSLIVSGKLNDTFSYKSESLPQ